MTVTVRTHEGTLDFPDGADWVVGEKGELLVTDSAGEEIIAEFTPHNWKGVWKHQQINEQLDQLAEDSAKMALAKEKK